MTNSNILKMAKQMYDEYSGNHPTIHCNRFPSWSELHNEDKEKWCAKATAELMKSCTCPSGNGSLRWPCPVHPPVDTELCNNRPATSTTKELSERLLNKICTTLEDDGSQAAFDSCLCDLTEALTQQLNVKGKALWEAYCKVVVGDSALTWEQLDNGTRERWNNIATIASQ